MESSKEVPKKIKNRTNICFNNIPIGYISKGNEIGMLKTHLQSLFIVTMVTIAKKGDNLSVHYLIKMNQENVVYTMEYYSTINMKLTSIICDNMDRTEIIILSDVSQAKKDIHHMISYMECEKVDLIKVERRMIFPRCWG